MAVIHRATLEPTKIELLSRWLPQQPWYDGGEQVSQIASYRLDDPDGEVGTEGFLLDVGTETPLHVAMTYRSAPLPGADAFLIGTTEHSVLGTRYVYNGCGDPVWIAAVVTTILTGGTEASEEVAQPDGTTIAREPAMHVRGSGGGSTSVPVGESLEYQSDREGIAVITLESFQLIMVQKIGTPIVAEGTLTGTWDDHSAVLAGIHHV